MLPRHSDGSFHLRDEFLNCVYPSVEEISAYARHPFMAKLCHDVLDPMDHYLSCIRAEFCPPEESKASWKKRAMRVRIRDYLDHAVCVAIDGLRLFSDPGQIFQERLSDMIIEYRELAQAHRVPVPRVAFLREIMRAESVYGFQGDDDMLLRAILRGKLASLHKYSDKLRQRAGDEICRSAKGRSSPDDGSTVFTRSSSGSEEEGEMTEV